MRAETSDWLEPMFLEVAEKRPDIEVGRLMAQATMPAAEADNPFLDWMVENAAPGARVGGLDWIRFGELLRHELGWDDIYPAQPAFHDEEP